MLYISPEFGTWPTAMLVAQKFKATTVPVVLTEANLNSYSYFVTSHVFPLP